MQLYYLFFTSCLLIDIFKHLNFLVIAKMNAQGRDKICKHKRIQENSSKAYHPRVTTVAFLSSVYPGQNFYRRMVTLFKILCSILVPLSSLYRTSFLSIGIIIASFNGPMISPHMDVLTKNN
jgi:hypothetical protein